MKAFPRVKWCVDCGAVQWGPSSCEACNGTYRFRPLRFEDLYLAYAGPLRRFVRRLAADRGLPESLADTESIVHDTFVVLLSGSRQPIRNPAAWLFTVARNQVSKAAAAQRRIAPGDPADHLSYGGGAWATLVSPPADAEDVRAAREVMYAIARLPDHQRIATYLRQVQGWSLAEIGAYLNCAASTAGVHISRGTAKVRSDRRISYHKLGDGYVMSLLRRRPRRRPALAAVGTLAAALIAGAAARALGMPWWLAAVTAAAAGILALSARAVRLRRQEAAWRRLLEKASDRRRLRTEADAVTEADADHERRFNLWLRTGRPLDPPGAIASPDRPGRGPRLRVPGPRSGRAGAFPGLSG